MWIWKKRTQLQKKLFAIIYCGISIGLVKWNYFDWIEQIIHKCVRKKVASTQKQRKLSYILLSVNVGWIPLFSMRSHTRRWFLIFECRIRIESIVHLIFLIFLFFVSSDDSSWQLVLNKSFFQHDLIDDNRFIAVKVTLSLWPTITASADGMYYELAASLLWQIWHLH